jgi:hypothetical protein
MSSAAKRPPPRRAREERAPLADFADEILVVCPRCAGPAITKRIGPARRDTVAKHRLVCRCCSHLEVASGRRRAHAEREGRDPFLGLPLWLATPCCGEILSAFNARHLAALEAFALAELRERRRDPEHGWSNASFASRLPKWIKLAKNRDEVSKALARLKAKLPMFQ